MQFRKYIILGIGILSLGLWACGKDNSDDAAESEIGQENIEESQEEMETVTTESASENVAEDRDLPDAGRVVYGQTFDVNLEGWGKVTFVTYKPKSEGEDAEYKLFRGGEEVYTFEHWEEENYVATKAVAFRDYNGDGYKDVIIIGQYGDMESQCYDVARVFIQMPGEQKFQIDNLLCEALSKNNYADSVESVMAYREEYLSHIPWHMPENISYAESKVIADNCDMWLNFMDYANEVEAYAVTDLDKNGRAEIIVSNMGGTGYYTYTRIFEINEEHDGLEEVKTDFVEGNSQPDMISFGEPVTVYIDNDFVHHYIMEDYLKATAAEYYNVIYDVTLQEGHLSCQVLARRSELYTDGSEKVEYEDGRGQKITEEIYKSITDNVFSDANRKETHIWGWQDLEELKDLSNEELRKKIDESFLKQEVLP